MAEVLAMPKHPCPFCKKNESTQFCDFIIDYFWTSAKDEKGRMIGSTQATCDNQICQKCAVSGGGKDFCPSCAELYEYVKKNHKRMPGRLLAEKIFGGEGADKHE